MNNVDIFVNIYVQYPEVYNGYVIENRLNKYFKKYYSESNTYVKFNTAPMGEEQIMIIETMVDVSKFKVEWNDFLSVFFDHQITKIIYK